MPGQKGWFAVAFIFFTLSIPFAVTYYASTQEFKDGYGKSEPQSPAPSPPLNAAPSNEQETPGQIFLVKDEKVTVHNTCLVYKGLSGMTVNMDLYILELDPDIPYPLKFSRQSVTDGIWLGDVLYQAVSVKDNILRLKIQDSYNTL